MSDDDPRDVPLEGLLATFAESMRRGMFTSEPGKIAAYDPARRRASVQLQIPRAHVDDQQERVVQTVGQVHDVPVVFLGPARGAITWPVAVGDDCLVWFASSSTRRWRSTGKVVDPGDDRTHDVNDAFCMVVDFFGPFDAPTDTTVVRGKNKLGGSTGTEPTLMATSWKTAFDTLIAAIATAVGGIVGGTAAGTAITSAKTAFDTAAPGFTTVETEVK